MNITKREKDFLVKCFGTGYKNYVPFPKERPMIDKLIEKNILYYKGIGYYCLTQIGLSVLGKMLSKI